MPIAYEGSSHFVAVRRVALHWRPAAWVFGVCFGLTLLISLLLPSKYQAHLKILVRNEPADLAPVGDRQNEVSDTEVNTEIQLLTSEDVLRKVVRDQGLAEGASARWQPVQRREETALRHLERDLTVAAIRNANVIEATYESRDPHRAAEVLESLSRAYLASHQALSGSQQSYALFAELSAKNAGELAGAEAELASFRRQHSIITLPEQKSLALESIARLEARMDESTAAARKSEETAGRLRQEISALPATVERGRRSMPDQASAEQLGALLITLKNKRAEMVLRYRPEDRNVRELDAQIAQTASALDTAEHTRAEEISTGANPALDAAQTQYVELIADQAGDQAEARETAQQLRVNQSKLAALDAQSATYDSLVRRVSELEALDATYRAKSRDARMAELAGSAALSEVAIVEEPVAPSLPSSPRRGLILAFGFVWSMLFAFATALGRDLWVERILSPFALEQAMGIPALAAVPMQAAVPGSGSGTGSGYGATFAALYLAMQRTPATSDRRSS